MRTGILPHYLTRKVTNSRLFDSDNFTNDIPHLGEVVQVHYPEDPGNRSKKQIEYTVRVEIRRGNGIAVTTLYHCTVSDKFGSAADYERHTYRTSSGDKDGAAFTDGARVLILCPNGETNNAVIVSAVKHHSAAPDHPRADGHCYERVFNGVTLRINDDGEVLVMCEGKTENDGGGSASRDPANRGSTIQILKNGTVRVENKAGEVIEVDTPNRHINIRAQAQDHSAERSWTLTTGEDVTIGAGRDLVVRAENDARLDAGGSVRIGGAGANENLVLGQKLVEALDSLVKNVFIQNAPSIGLFTGAPVQLHPTVVAALTQWLVQYLAQGGVPPILATDKFTER